MIIKLKRRQAEYDDLTPGQPYGVIGIEADDYRLLNDRGEPFLYPADLFDLVDGTEPEDWENEQGAAGERYAYPAPLNEVGFFEDFFERKPTAVRTFWQVVNRRLALAAA